MGTVEEMMCVVCVNLTEECFVMHMFYVGVLCASCDSSQCCIPHDLPFVNDGRGCKRQHIWKRHTPEPVS